MADCGGCCMFKRQGRPRDMNEHSGGVGKHNWDGDWESKGEEEERINGDKTGWERIEEVYGLERERVERKWGRDWENK